MSANTGALIGSQLLRGDDAPLYRRGFKVCVALVSLGLLTSIGQHVQYRLSNRRIARKEALGREDLEGEDKTLGGSFKSSRYTI
jgi:hypothetical protein